MTKPLAGAVRTACSLPTKPPRPHPMEEGGGAARLREAVRLQGARSALHHLCDPLVVLLLAACNGDREEAQTTPTPSPAGRAARPCHPYSFCSCRPCTTAIFRHDRRCYKRGRENREESCAKRRTRTGEEPVCFEYGWESAWLAGPGKGGRERSKLPFSFHQTACTGDFYDRRIRKRSSASGIMPEVYSRSQL